MAKLLLSKDGEVLREFPLLAQRMTIGRRAGHDICIEDPLVSHDHATIVTVHRNSFIEDLGSTNGTFVNGAPIKKHLLRHNDVITVGEHRLCYLGADGNLGEGADYCKTLVIPSQRGSQPEPTPSAPAPAPAPAEAAKPLPAWRNPKNRLAAALTVLALSIWGNRLFEAGRVERTAAPQGQTSVIECKKLYNRVEAETMSPEKAHDAVFAAFKQGACKD